MKTDATPRGSYAVGVEKRRLIIEAAADEFAAHGYRGTSLAKIADRVGLTQQGVLHYFRTKQDLLVAVLERRDEVDDETIGLLDPDSSMGHGVEALHRLVRLMDLNARRRGMIQLFTVIVGESVTTDHPAHAWARRRYHLVRSAIARSLELGIEDGSLQPDVDAEAVASALVAVMDGLQIQWLLDDSVDLVGRFRGYVARLEADLTAGPERA